MSVLYSVMFLINRPQLLQTCTLDTSSHIHSTLHNSLASSCRAAVSCPQQDAWRAQPVWYCVCSSTDPLASSTRATVAQTCVGMCVMGPEGHKHRCDSAEHSSQRSNAFSSERAHDCSSGSSNSDDSSRRDSSSSPRGHRAQPLEARATKELLEALFSSASS